jgi:membrane protein required for colicin V production
MNIDLAEFANFFDIFCLIIIIASALLSLRAGLLKNLLNLAKWIALITVLKYSFGYLRVPFKEALNLSPTLIDIIIFISVFIISYVTFTLINRLIIGLISSDRSGAIDRLFGFLFGIVRGYIIVVIIFSIFSNWNFSNTLLKSYKNDSVLYQSIDKGKELFKIIPREIEEKLELI